MQNQANKKETKKKKICPEDMQENYTHLKIGVKFQKLPRNSNSSKCDEDSDSVRKNGKILALFFNKNRVLMSEKCTLLFGSVVSQSDGVFLGAYCQKSVYAAERQLVSGKPYHFLCAGKFAVTISKRFLLLF
jgi:hypothetical protein